MSLPGLALLVFGVVSSVVLIGVGLKRAVQRRYRDRTGVVLEGGRAVRAGLVVFAVGLGELALTAVLWAALR